MKPKGFWSYARGDDEHLDGVFTSLRKRLEGEISMLLGYDVDIFQDTYDLRTGDRWAETLRDEITEAAFLIPVLTPRFFNRDWCREEALTYVTLAEEKGLEPLIFPIRFIEYDDEAGCEVRAALEPFQYKDFSGWRLESDPTKRTRLEYEFAQDVKARLKQPIPRKASPRPEPAPAPSERAAETERSDAPDLRPVVQELTVDEWPGRGDFTTIKAAMEAAQPGARIVIRPGTYTENLVLDKPLELIGEGARDAVLVAVTSGRAMKVTASLGLVRNIRFQRGEGKGKNAAVWVTAGRCAFEDCSFTSRSLAQRLRSTVWGRPRSSCAAALRAARKAVPLFGINPRQSLMPAGSRGMDCTGSGSKNRPIRSCCAVCWRATRRAARFAMRAGADGLSSVSLRGTGMTASRHRNMVGHI